MISAVRYLIVCALLCGTTTADDAPIFEAKGLTKPVRSKGVAATVTYPGKTYKMVFRLPWQAGYVTERGVQCLQGYAETFDRKNCEGCAEVCQDKESRYARMWIEHQSPARIVIRTRGALCDKNYKIAHSDLDSGSPYGKGDWVDEWYYIYPDGTCTRVVTIYTGLAQTAASSWGRKGHPFECQETILIGKGRPPTDDIKVDALTLLNMSGQQKTISFKPYPPKGTLLPKANIQIVNLKTGPSPFTIIPDVDAEISPYYGPKIDHQHLDKRTFVGWPRGEAWGKNYCVALSHVVDWKGRRTKNTFTRIHLLGMLDEKEKAATLILVAKSWLRPPKFNASNANCRAIGYNRKQKAYILRKTGDGPVTCTIAATEESPLMNPAFIIEGWGDGKVTVMVNGKLASPRLGYEKVKGRTDLVIWLKQTYSRPFTLRVGRNPPR